MAVEFGMITTHFINDKVLMNIYEKKPQSLKDLWSIDGISNDFIMSDKGQIFIERYKCKQILLRPENFVTKIHEVTAEINLKILKLS